MVIAAWLVACATGGGGPDSDPQATTIDPCSPDLGLSLVIGHGESAYAPLEATDPVLELVHGPQGGYHVVLGLQATGLDAASPVQVTLEGRLDGELVAETKPVATFRCNQEAGGLQAWDLLLIMVEGIEPADVHGRWLDIAATATDVAGDVAEASAGATVLDPELE